MTEEKATEKPAKRRHRRKKDAGPVPLSRLTVFRTGDIAHLCHVAPRTVSKWFDSGRLKGYRIPGSQDRRVPRADLIRFLKESGMPLGELEQDGPLRVLYAGVSESLSAPVPGRSDQHDQATVGCVVSAAEAIVFYRPHVLVIDYSFGPSLVGQLAGLAVRRSAGGEAPSPTLVVVCGEDTDPDNLKACGIHHVFQQPFDPNTLHALLAAKAAELNGN